MKASRRPAITLLCAAAIVGAAASASAQSLRGSNASVALMHRRAVRVGFDFYETTSQVRRAVARGDLVALKGNANYAVSNVRMPYVRPATRAFVKNLAVDYRRKCGQRLVVTSATRPMSRKLANGSALSVHPTGMAIDLRRPSGRCLTWLRRTLLAAERRGAIEATEERRPPHFHVAVLPPRLQKATTESARPSTTRQAPVKRWATVAAGRPPPESRHAPQGIMLAQTAGLLRELGSWPVITDGVLAAIPHPVRIGVGDRDATVSIDECVAAMRCLPKGELEVHPGTSHPFEKVPIERLARSLMEFFG